MTRIQLSGTPLQKGRIHGETCRDLIHARRERVLSSAINALLETKAFANHCNQIEKMAPLIYAELAGIAEASNISIREVIALSSFEFLSDIAETGCTSLAVTSNEGTFVAQNWDASDAMRDELVLLHHDGEHHETLIVAPAGGLCWVGMNSHGLALVNNDLVLHGYDQALPSQVVRRLILEQSDTQAALNRISELSHPAGRTYLIGDRSGDLACIEVAAKERPQFERSNDRLSHANHPQMELIKTKENSNERIRLYPSSDARQIAIDRCLGIMDHPTLDDIKRCLTDHENFPLSVCKHLTDLEPSQTVLSVIFNPSFCSIHICLGSPCKSEFHVIQV